MKKVICVTFFYALCLISPTIALAADGFFVIPVGTRSIGYNDVIHLHNYVFVYPNNKEPLDGGPVLSPPDTADYMVPADKLLVITTVHITPQEKSPGTYKYRVTLQQDTPPGIDILGALSPRWKFSIVDSGSAQAQAFQFSPGLVFDEGTMVTVDNYGTSSGGVLVEVEGYLIKK